MSTISVPSEKETKAINVGVTVASLMEPVAQMAAKKFITSAMVKLESKACQLVIRQIASKVVQRLVTQVALKAIVGMGSRAIAMTTLAAMGPIGWAIDAFLFVTMIAQATYDSIDPNNYKETYFRATVEEILTYCENQSRYEAYQTALASHVELIYPVEVDGLYICDSREWAIDDDKDLANAATYTDEIVQNLYKNSRGEIIDLRALCEADENIDRSLITHPPSWNQAIQESIEPIIPSQKRANAIHQELDRECKLLEGLVPMGWISLLSVGFTIAFYDLSGRKSNFSYRATDKPAGYMQL